MTTARVSAAHQFHQLHASGILLLANAWDAGSARLIESLRAKAIATTSAAVAWSHGYADGDRLPVKLLLETVAEIVRVIRVPLSVDIEGGYSADPTTVGETVAAVIDAGAVGINLEDGTGQPDLLCAKIEKVRQAADRTGVNLFLNARTDTYLRNTVPVERRLEETLARAEWYRSAGASGIFVPGVTDRAAIHDLTSKVRLPLNILARAGLPPAAELAALGVRRLSAGSGIAEVLYGKAAVVAAEFLQHGTSEPLADGAMAYAQINALMGAR